MPSPSQLLDCYINDVPHPSGAAASQLQKIFQSNNYGDIWVALRRWCATLSEVISIDDLPQDQKEIELDKSHVRERQAHGAQGLSHD